MMRPLVRRLECCRRLSRGPKSLRYGRRASVVVAPRYASGRIFDSCTTTSERDRCPAISSSSSSMSTLSSKADDPSSASRVAKIRLYRILQRQCRALEKQLQAKGAPPAWMERMGIANGNNDHDGKDDNNSETKHHKDDDDSCTSGRSTGRSSSPEFMLQAPLDPHRGGLPRTIPVRRAPHAGKRSILRYFYLWNIDRFEPDQHDDFRNLGEDDEDDDGNAFTILTNDNDDTSDDDDDDSMALMDEWYHSVVVPCENDSDNGSANEEDKDFELVTFDGNLWTTVSAMQDAIRFAFRQSPAAKPTRETTTTSGPFRRSRRGGAGPRSKSNRQDVLYQQWAIRAFQFLQEQEQFWQQTSVSVYQDHIRVTARAACIGQSLSRQQPRNFNFAYRIQIEHLSRPSTKDNAVVDDHHDDLDTPRDDSSPLATPPAAVKLLGRHWDIQGYIQGQPIDEPTIVNDPAGGAVGKYPVLVPGEAFVYMSGTNLRTMTGIMKGHFYFERVRAPLTPGERLDEMHRPPLVQPGAALDNREGFFRVPVRPFPLSAEDQ